MTDTLLPKSEQTSGPVPRRLIIIVICALCLFLLGSALFIFVTLSRLRVLYLANRGHAIIEAIELQARGPGKRNNPAFWQTLLDANYETYSKSVAFLALVDKSNNVLAVKGDSSLGSLQTIMDGGNDIYIFEEALARPRYQHDEQNRGVAGWRIRIGLYSADAEFIRRLALVQLAISGLAIIALVALSTYLVRMLRRFLELKAKEGAEAQLKSLGIMAASLAHEIRNPLGAMKGLTQLAQEDLASDHAAQEHLRTVVTEAQRLEGLVTNLLDFARPKEPQISEFNLHQLLSDVKTMLQPKLKSLNLNLQITAEQNPLTIRSDSSGLRQVLLNVMLNAMDASAPGDTVSVEIVRGEGTRSVVIQVDDSGHGLGDRDPGELFQPFVTTKSRGTGLGLVVSRQIIESLGGSLSLRNNPAGGARCSIELPIQ